jgi:hypothetical protein
MAQQIVRKLVPSLNIMVLLAMMAVRVRIALNRNPIFDHPAVAWPNCRVDRMPERPHHVAAHSPKGAP